MRNELQSVLQTLRDIPADELPGLIGELESLKAAAWARLSVPSPAPQQQDQLIDVEQAAQRLSVSADYLYRHSKDFAFTRRMGKRLLFSSSGIDRYLKASR